MAFKHIIVEITADFEIEPIINDYLKKYPNEDYATYKVLFKTQDEYDTGEFSYILLLIKSAPKVDQQAISFYDFLKSYCMYENRRAVLADHTLPQIGQGHSFGAPKPRKSRQQS